MKPFTFIFRQGKKLLTQDELKQRAEEVRAWAMIQMKQERKLDPHILGADGFRVAPDGEVIAAPPVGEGSVIAIVFFEAMNLDEAAAIAKTHPGLRYGSSIEVREWSSPPNVLPISDLQKPTS